MSGFRDKIVNLFQRRLANPITKLNPGQTLLETTGRKSGEPRRTAVGGRRVGDQFWLVAEFGEGAQYVKNIRANPRVRLRLRGHWLTGTAHPVPEDDPVARLEQLPAFNSFGVRTFGSDLLSIRLDLD